MNLKIEALKALIFFALGGFIFVNYWPKSGEEVAKKPEAKQEQAQVCKAVLKKRTNPDGSIDEIAEFLASNSQSQSVKPAEPVKIKLNGLGLFKDELILKRKVLQDVKILGFNFDVDAIGKASKDKADAGVMIEW